MHDLISGHFSNAFGSIPYGDSAVLPNAYGRIAVTTDSYVVSPLFFPGGDIGALSINGTVNDLLMSGATPKYITAGFIIEEGFEIISLQNIVRSMADAAKAAGVSIVAGDTKVVERGKGDGLFINTSGFGIVQDGVNLSVAEIRPGDSIIISGHIGSHGMAVMAHRNGLSFDPLLLSDTAALNDVAMAALGSGGLRVMRDPTRGGLLTTLKEFAEESGLCMVVDEKAVPIKAQVRGACELLGLDPMYVANEGVMVAVVDGDMAEYTLKAMRDAKHGKHACIIGQAQAEPAKTVLVKTEIGGLRTADMLQAEQLPRIC